MIRPLIVCSHILHAIHAWYYWNVRVRIREDIVAIRTRRVYRKTLPAVQARVKAKGRIRVLFLVYDLAKWKSQLVLERMIADPQFEPIVVLTAADTDWQAPKYIVQKKHEEMLRFFTNQSVPCYDSYDSVSNSAGALEEYEPDIVYYSQPWGYDARQDPATVAHYALTCYVPYFVPNYGYAKMDCNPIFHRTVYAYFILNNLWADYFRVNVASWRRACSYVPTGHPGLDYFSEAGVSERAFDEQFVIYAPHWSIPHENNENKENYSTFLETGRPMLEYAKAHPEFKWVFKPHPTLKVTLITTGAMTRDEVEACYAEWERIGTACYTGDYQKLFLDSRLLITDCGSFLSEYGSTGKPIVWLKSKKCKIKLLDFNKRLYDTYYKAFSWTEAEEILSKVLVKGLDPDRGRRMKALEVSGLQDSHAAERIVAYCKGALLGE